MTARTVAPRPRKFNGESLQLVYHGRMCRLSCGLDNAWSPLVFNAWYSSLRLTVLFYPGTAERILFHESSAAAGGGKRSMKKVKKSVITGREMHLM